MQPHPNDPPYKTTWEPAWDEIEDDIDFAGLEYYDLPDGTRIYPGDKFWKTDDRFVIEVSSVKTKVKRDSRGNNPDPMGTHVFYDPDWTPPRDPHTRSHYTDDIHYMSEEEFAKLLGEGTLVAHRGNGLPRRPP